MEEVIDERLIRLRFAFELRADEVDVRVADVVFEWSAWIPGREAGELSVRAARFYSTASGLHDSELLRRINRFSAIVPGQGGDAPASAQCRIRKCFSNPERQNSSEEG